VCGGEEVPRIALVGPMGVGKSSVGRGLSRALGWPFVDLDAGVEEAAGRSIASIFQFDGEQTFRRMEFQRLHALTTDEQVQDVVCATGGGVVETSENRMLLLEHWTTIWLDADIETLASRVFLDTTTVRPLVHGRDEDSVRRRLHELYLRREAWYQEVAQLRVQVSCQTPEQVVDQILQSDLLGHARRWS